MNANVVVLHFVFAAKHKEVVTVCGHRVRDGVRVAGFDKIAVVAGACAVFVW